MQPSPCLAGLLPFHAKRVRFTLSKAFAFIVVKLRDLGDTALNTYDSEHTNLVSSKERTGCPPDSPSLARLAAAHVLVCFPVFGVAYTEVCYSAYVKTSDVCGTASRVRSVG